MEPVIDSGGWLVGAQPRFVALLPPGPTVRFRSEPRFPTNESLAQFGHHIVAGLHDYSDTEEDRDLSTAFKTDPLARFNQHAINRAIQDLAKESALELARSLVPRLKARFQDRVPIAKPDDSSRKTALENCSPEEQFRSDKPVKESENEIPAEKGDGSNQLEKVQVQHSAVRRDEPIEKTSSTTPYDYLLSDDLLVKDNPDQAVEKEREVVAEFQNDPVAAKRVSQLALHDFILLADDCKSVEWSAKRVSATKEVVQELFRIATIESNQRKFDLHFFDDAGFSKTSDIKSDADIKDMISRVGSTNGEAVPCPLHERILRPLAETIDQGGLQHPTLVAIITSGGQTNLEQANNLADVISDFKDNLRRRSIGADSPGVFLVFLRVGNNEDAAGSLDHFEKDERIHDVVCYSKENLAHQMNLEASDSGTLTCQLVELLAQTLDEGGR